MSTARQYGTGGRGTPRQDPQFYSQVQDEGVALPQEIALNFVGGGVTAADDAANVRTNVTIPLGAGLNPPIAPGENNMVCWGLNGNLEYGAQLFTDGTYLGIGAAAGLADAGALRFVNTGAINWRNAAGAANVAGLTVDGTNQVILGGANALAVGIDTTAAATGNIWLHTPPAAWQNMVQGMFVGDANTLPTAAPAAGGFMYSTGGAGTWYGSGDTITTFGAAEPHCQRCGLDWALEAKNPRLGWHYGLCLRCLVETLDRHGIARDEYMIFDEAGHGGSH